MKNKKLKFILVSIISLLILTGCTGNSRKNNNDVRDNKDLIGSDNVININIDGNDYKLYLENNETVNEF